MASEKQVNLCYAKAKHAGVKFDYKAAKEWSTPEVNDFVKSLEGESVEKKPVQQLQQEAVKSFDERPGELKLDDLKDMRKSSFQTVREAKGTILLAEASIAVLSMKIGDLESKTVTAEDCAGDYSNAQTV